MSVVIEETVAPDELEQIPTQTERQHLAVEMLRTLDKQGWCQGRMFTDAKWIHGPACLLGHARINFGGASGDLDALAQHAFGVEEWMEIARVNDRLGTKVEDIRVFLQAYADGHDFERARYELNKSVYERTGMALAY